MRRKAKLQPDTRPHWYDDLKVYFSGKWYSAEEYRLLCAKCMSYFSRAEPHWKNDPTYDLRKKKK